MINAIHGITKTCLEGLCVKKIFLNRYVSASKRSNKPVSGLNGPLSDVKLFLCHVHVSMLFPILSIIFRCACQYPINASSFMSLYCTQTLRTYTHNRIIHYMPRTWSGDETICLDVCGGSAPLL